MTDSTNPRALQWSSSPSARAKSAVQRSVTQLLDELAPERVLKRVGEVRGPVEQHRTPTGCVLQAADCAVSLSWFADATKQAGRLSESSTSWSGAAGSRDGGMLGPRKGQQSSPISFYVRSSRLRTTACGRRLTALDMTPRRWPQNASRSWTRRSAAVDLSPAEEFANSIVRRRRRGRAP